MIFKKLLKSIFMATFLLTAVFDIQPAYAMDDENTGILNVCGVHKTYKKVLDFIGKGETVFEPGQLSFQSQIPFFVGLGDDVTFYVVSQLCTTKQAIKALGSIALTCQKGYELMKNKLFWGPLKKTYFSHLPDEYIATCIEDKSLSPRAWTRNLLQKLAYQPKEIRRLGRILDHLDVPEGIDKDDRDFPLQHVPQDVLLKLSKELRRTMKRLGKLEHTQKIFLKKEEILEIINEKLICECLKHIAQQTGPTGPFININLRSSITRLPKKAIKHIREKILLAGDDATIRVSLACNELRWAPNELFSIKEIHILDLRNNRLTFLPSAIENLEENITELWLRNYNAYRFYGDGTVYMRTQGNTFKTVPSSILNLRKLVHLDLRSVCLSQFSQEEIYAALPNLSTLNLDLNNLKILPQSTNKKRTVAVTAIGNSLQTLDWNTVKYVYHNTAGYVYNKFLMPEEEAPIRCIAFGLVALPLFALYTRIYWPPIGRAACDDWLCQL